VRVKPRVTRGRAWEMRFERKPQWEGALALLGTCRQISLEALQIAYAEVVFDVSSFPWIYHEGQVPLPKNQGLVQVVRYHYGKGVVIDMLCGAKKSGDTTEKALRRCFPVCSASRLDTSPPATHVRMRTLSRKVPL
jgi:hypothetical protein